MRIKNKTKIFTRKVLAVLLTAITLFSVLPVNVSANESGGVSLIPPDISTARIGNQSAIFIDFSVWETALSSEVTNIRVEPDTDYVLPFMTENALVLIFPENVPATASHNFAVAVSIRGHGYPLLAGLNGLGEISNISQMPSGNSPNSPDSSDVNEDWFLLNPDLVNNNPPVYLYENPNIASPANGRLDVWGGEVFWDQEQEIWNFPRATRSLTIA